MATKLMSAAAIAVAMTLTSTALQAQTSQPKQMGQSAKQPSKQLSAADKSFLKEAMQGDMAEVQMGHMAEQKGADQGVRQFGQTLATDHGQHLEKAKSLAQSVGATVPQSVNDQQKSEFDRLNKLSGKQFDQQFVHHMVQDHKKDIAKYEKQAKGSGQLADFAQQTLPTLKKHLEIAQSLAGNQTIGKGR